jgi:hypothetical protein
MDLEKITLCTLETAGYVVAGATFGALTATFPAMLEVFSGHDLNTVFNNFKNISSYSAIFAGGMKLLDCYLSGDKNNYSQTF